MKLRYLFLSAGLLLLPGLSAVNAGEGWGPVQAERVAEGIHVLRAQGGNIGVVTGADGVILIDDQFAPLTAQIRAALDALPGGKGRAVRFVLNTHFHGDHTGGNENLGKAGAVIVAHDNVRLRMTTEEFRANFLESGGADLEAALPVVTFNDRVTFHVNGHTLDSRHYPHAHTDGDSVVWFREHNVVHMGDIYFQAGYPFIDIDHGGSIDGMINAVQAVLAEVDDDTIVIPGHGATADKAGLQEYADMLLALREAVAAAMQDGATLETIGERHLSKAFDARWNWEVFDGETFVETIYRSLEKTGTQRGR